MDQDDEISLFDYDTAGNMTAKTTQVQSGGITVSGTFEYLWNGYGQIQTVLDPEGSITEYGYGSNGLRVRKTTPEAETRYLCQAASVIIETDGDGFIAAKNVRGLRLISRETGDETFGYLYNGHGDVTARTTPSATAVNTWTKKSALLGVTVELLSFSMESKLDISICFIYTEIPESLI